MNLDFKYNHKIVEYLIRIEKYKTALNYLYLPTRAKQKMMYDAKLKKTHFSTSIEGNVLSYNQVEKVIQSKDDNHRLNYEQEVQNYWDALTFLEECKKANRKIDVEFIYDLHDRIERKGKVKRIGFREAMPSGVLFAVYDSKTRIPEYIPPEHNDIEKLMNDLLKWYKESNDLAIPIVSAIIHYALVTIHPFFDGNGRTARALATYVLMLNDYDMKGFNSFEEYYMNDLNGYYDAIQMNLPALFYDGRCNPPHLEIWIEYFLKIMVLNAENIYEQALEASKKEENPILANLTKRDKVLIRYCLEQNMDIIKNKELAVLFGVTTRAISKWTSAWVEKGILVPVSGKDRITGHRLKEIYQELKLSDIEFVE